MPRGTEADALAERPAARLPAVSVRDCGKRFDDLTGTILGVEQQRNRKPW
ncbi:hypothetical protein [Methylomagnum sp.]